MFPFSKSSIMLTVAETLQSDSEWHWSPPSLCWSWYVTLQQYKCVLAFSPPQGNKHQALSTALKWVAQKIDASKCAVMYRILLKHKYQALKGVRDSPVLHFVFNLLLFHQCPPLTCLVTQHFSSQWEIQVWKGTDG